MSIELNVTAAIEDSEGDMICVSCKHVFGIVNCTSLGNAVAEANFCPHCGARIVHVHTLDGECLDDIAKEVVES